MWKALGLLALGLVAGAGFYLYTRPDSAAGSLLVTAGDSQNVDVQRSLAALDQRVQDLTAQVQALKAAAGGPPAAFGERPPIANGQRRPNDWQGGRDGGPPRTPEQEAAMRERLAEFQKQREEQLNERIRAAGLTPERVKDIERRAEELRVAAMQAQYEAQRTGQRVENTNVDAALRKELGDIEYEKYRKATGQPTDVRVTQVYATSSAERAGLKAGDEIVSYNGKRVFDPRELNTMTSQVPNGGSVTVEIKRNGQTMQVSVPAGPLGLQAGNGGGGRRQGGQGGPGGGFRGGRAGGP